MFRIMTICLVGSFLLSAPLHAQDTAVPDTLDRLRVVQLALERAPEVLDADARRLEAEGRMSGARILTGNPMIDVVTGDGPDGVDNRTDLELSVPIGFGLKRSRRIGIAKAELQRDDRLAADARRLAVGAALAAYYRVLHATDRLAIARQRLVVDERLRAAVADRLSSGDVARLDLSVVETEVSKTRSDVFVEEQRVIEEKAGLARILGLSSMSGREVTGNLGDRSLFEALPDTFGSRPDVQAAASQLDAAGAEQSLAGTAALPDLYFRLNYEQAGDYSEWLPGFALSIPIFDRGQGVRAETKARANRARLELDRRVAAAASEQEASRAAFAAAVASVQELEAHAVLQAVEIETMSEESYLNGKSNLGSMLVLRREVLQTRRDYLDRLLEAALRGVDVGLAIGLWP